LKRTARLSRFSGGLVLIAASIDSAMIAGIAANNASGMCAAMCRSTYQILWRPPVSYLRMVRCRSAAPTAANEFIGKRPPPPASAGDLVTKIAGARTPEGYNSQQRIRHKILDKDTPPAIACMTLITISNDPLDR